MAEGLLHCNRCVVPILWVYFTSLTAGSIIPPAYRSRSLWCKVVVVRHPEADHGWLSGKLNALELELELLTHVAARLVGLAELARRAVSCFFASRMYPVRVCGLNPDTVSEFPSCRLCLLNVM